jgi:hypothetical protein
MRRILWLTALVLAAATAAAAAPFWHKPYREWTREQVQKLLSDSPWARSFSVGFYRGRRALPSEGLERGTYRGISDAAPGESEIYQNYVVRLFSARPVRQAHLRLLQILNDYDRMKPAEQAVFDAQLERLAHYDPQGRVVVSLEFDSNDRGMSMEVNRFLRVVQASELKQKAYLISDSLGRLELEDYEPPSPDGTGAKFIFPREVRGEPAVTRNHKHLKFEYQDPVSGQKVYVEWKVADLLWQGELEL